jgi:uncharacterized protein (TIGR03435 family)
MQTLRSILIVMAAGGAFGQATDVKPAFEVASIRAAAKGIGEGRGRESIQFSPDSVTMRNVSLKSSLQWAYHVMEMQVQGPPWLGSDRYDIVAKSGSAVSEEQLRLMVQDLLAERFHVALHRLTKESAAYVLTVGKNGPKVQESKSEGGSDIQPQKERMIIAAQRVPVSMLTETLSRILQTPVIDMTGLKGKYDVTINVAKYLADLQPSGGGPPDVLGVLMTGLQEELGLKLEAKKMQLDFLVVDRAEKIPGEN